MYSNDDQRSSPGQDAAATPSLGSVAPYPPLRWLFTPRVLQFISLRHNMAI